MAIDYVFASKVRYLIHHELLMMNPTIVAQAIHYDWIKATIDSDMTEGYELTEIGKIVLGTWDGSIATSDPQSEPVASTPDSATAGERRFHYHLDSRMDATHVRRGELPDSNAEIVATFDVDETEDVHAETCLNAIENETAALRSQVAALTAENNRLQEAIDKAHGHIINAHDMIPKNINGTGFIVDALETIEAVLPDED